MPPPPVFHALFLSFHVSLPGSPGLGITYHRHSSLPVLASRAATQPRVPASPAPLAMRTLSSTAVGKVGDDQVLPQCNSACTRRVALVLDARVGDPDELAPVPITRVDFINR